MRCALSAKSSISEVKEWRSLIRLALNANGVELKKINEIGKRYPKKSILEVMLRTEECLAMRNQIGVPLELGGKVTSQKQWAQRRKM